MKNENKKTNKREFGSFSLEKAAVNRAVDERSQFFETPSGTLFYPVVGGAGHAPDYFCWVLIDLDMERVFTSPAYAYSRHGQMTPIDIKASFWFGDKQKHCVKCKSPLVWVKVIYQEEQWNYEKEQWEKVEYEETYIVCAKCRTILNS